MLPITLLSDRPQLQGVDLQGTGISLRLVQPDLPAAAKNFSSRWIKTSLASLSPYRDSLYVDQLLFSGNTVQAARAFDTITGSGGNGQGTTAKANASLDNAEITPFAGLLLGGGSVEPMGQTLSPFLAAANPAAPWLLSGQSLL